MKLSVVTPTLKEEKVLPDLLNDLALQTDPDFEVVVSDGNSNDQTREIALDFRKKIKNLRLVVSKKRGVSHQRNIGAKEVCGDWIVFMDADDKLDKDFIKKEKIEIKKYNPDMFTNWCNVDSKSIIDRLIALFINIGIEFGENAKYPMVNGSLLGVKKDVFRVVGGFDENMHFGEDTDFVRRCAKMGYKFKVFRKPRYVYSLRRARKMGKMNYLKKTMVLNFKRISNIAIAEKEHPMGGLLDDLKDKGYSK